MSKVKSKRGMSSVVTTLIIILLTIVALGVIWVVVKNVIQQGAEEIEIASYTLDLEIQSVKVEESNVTVVVVRRNPGQGEFVGMNFVFSDGQNSETVREDVVLEEAETREFTITLSELNADEVEEVSIYPIYRTTSGKESIGNVADKVEIKPKEFVSASSGGAFEELGFVGTGKWEATISSNPGIYPEFKSASVDPLDVLPGDNQTFTTTVYSPYNITNVTTITQLDNEILYLPLEKVYDDGNGTSTWSATWTVYDTHIETYRTNFTATDSAGNMDYTFLTWTDGECGFTHGSDSDVASSCTVGALSGADNSKIEVQSGVTLTLNSGGTVVYSEGYSVGKVGTGKIALSGGAIKKGYLYYNDGDTDSYGDGTLSYGTSSTAPGGKIRAKDSLGTDCNDGSGSLYQYLAGYADGDNDGYGAGSSQQVCSGSSLPSGYSSQDGDCNNNYAAVNPGATGWYTSARTDTGTYDYNCDSSETKKFNSVSSSFCSGCSQPPSSICIATSGNNIVGWTFGSASVPACGDGGWTLVQVTPPSGCQQVLESQGCH